MVGKTRRGYTLMETMMTVAILGIVITTSAPLMYQATNFWKLTSARYAIQRDVRTSIDMINRFTRQAQSATVVIARIIATRPSTRAARSFI